MTRRLFIPLAGALCAAALTATPALGYHVRVTLRVEGATKTVMPQLSVTTLGHWKVGTRVNLERALKVGDELGGHLVSGHVDGVGAIVDRRQDGGSIRLTVKAPGALMPFIAPKGSIALDGISLTVNEVGTETFGVNIIPITQEVTNLGSNGMGVPVNLEIDQVARYVARLLGKEGPAKGA